VPLTLLTLADELIERGLGEPLSRHVAVHSCGHERSVAGNYLPMVQHLAM
jgi:hypothetical protein